MACNVVTGSQDNRVHGIPTRFIGRQLFVHIIGGEFWSRSHLRCVRPVKFSFGCFLSILYIHSCYATS